jgi:hypothetical protein
MSGRKNIVTLIRAIVLANRRPGAHCLVLRPCPAGDAPASLCPPQRYRKDCVGFLNGFPMLLVVVGRLEPRNMRDLR